MSEETNNYGYAELTEIPGGMAAWQMRLKAPQPSKYGRYFLVGCEPATIVQAHQVVVLAEEGKPLPNIQVVFGFPTGMPIGMPSGQNLWKDGPIEIRGDAQRTDPNGYAQHVTGLGGQDIFIWDIDAEGDLKLPSVMVKNCTIQDTTKMPELNLEETSHLHGVKLTFQRRKV